VRLRVHVIWQKQIVLMGETQQKKNYIFLVTSHFKKTYPEPGDKLSMGFLSLMHLSTADFI